jgi:RNA polymerase sigma-70 factor (ECF subfamily)
MNREANNGIIRDDDDSDLIKAFQAGNLESFETLLIKYKDRVFNLCYRFLGDYDEAEDISQDVFVKVYNALNKFGFRSSFYTWLYRITLNTCKNRVNSLAFKKAKKNVQLENNENSELMKISEEGNNPAVQLERKERGRLIQQAINKLPPGQKTVIILRDIEGLSYEEIGNITGKRLGTVKSRLSRARLDLNKRLKGIL